MTSTEYELHPLCTLFPRLGDEEAARLAEDIKANGLREPITLCGGMILDGGNRYAACITAGVEPQFVEFDGPSIAAFVLSENLHRRHLTPGQQAAIVASIQDWSKAQVAGSNQHTTKAGPATLPYHSLSTVAKRAAQSGASERTQRMADKVARANPDLAKKVAHGDVTLPKAVEQVTGKKRKQSIVNVPAEIADYDPRDDQIKEAHDAIAQLVAENERLKERIAIEAWDAPEEEKLSATEIIDALRVEVTSLQAERNALIISRDKYQTECAQMKRQLAAQRREIDKLTRGAA